MGDQTGPDSSPSGWPGQLWLEGRTLVHLLDEQSRPTHMPRGPAKRTGPGFLNPAMAPARTRSVMLLNDALEHGWLARTDQSIRILDALCATGVRVRRWRNEIPSHLQKRLRITANDLDDLHSIGLKPLMQPIHHLKMFSIGLKTTDTETVTLKISRMG